MTKILTHILENKRHYIYLLLLSALGILFLIKGIPFFLIIAAIIVDDIIRDKNNINLPLLMLQSAGVMEAASWIITFIPCQLSVAGIIFTHLGSELYLLLTGGLYIISQKGLSYIKTLCKLSYTLVTAFCIMSCVLAFVKIPDTYISSVEEVLTYGEITISPADDYSKVLTSDGNEMFFSNNRYTTNQRFAVHQSAEGYFGITPMETNSYLLTDINNSILVGNSVGLFTGESKSGQLWYILQDPDQGFYVVPAYDMSLYLAPSDTLGEDGEKYFVLSSQPYYYSFSRQYSGLEYYWAFWAEGLKK